MPQPEAPVSRESSGATQYNSARVDHANEILTTTGLTYAAMHFVEGWSVFTTSRNVALSLIFVVLGYFGPGMIKTFLTLRTGNAWVHAIGYHAIAPHVMVDAPLMAKVFGLR